MGTCRTRLGGNTVAPAAQLLEAGGSLLRAGGSRLSPSSLRSPTAPKGCHWQPLQATQRQPRPHPQTVSSLFLRSQNIIPPATRPAPQSWRPPHGEEGAGHQPHPQQPQETTEPRRRPSKISHRELLPSCHSSVASACPRGAWVSLLGWVLGKDVQTLVVLPHPHATGQSARKPFRRPAVCPLESGSSDTDV